MTSPHVFSIDRKARHDDGNDIILAKTTAFPQNTLYLFTDIIKSEIDNSTNASFAEYSAHSNSTKFLAKMFRSEIKLLPELSTEKHPTGRT